MAGRIAYLGNIATQGLVLDLDAAIQGSYPKTGTLWTDISGNNNNGTLVNGPAYTGSDYGAIVFDGVDDLVNISSINFLSSTSPQTLSTFCKISLSGSSRDIISLNDSSTSSTVRLYYHSDNRFYASVVKQNVLDQGTSGSIITNTSSFYMVTGIFTGNVMDLYINGTPAGSKTYTTGGSGLLNNWSSVGASYNNSSPGNAQRWFSGSIAQAQIYNQSLTQFQVWQNFNAYKSRYGIPDIVTDGLILNLDAGNPYSYLSGSSGTTWSNTVAVSSSISGSLINGTTYSNGAMVFDGVDDYLRCPSISSSINPNDGITLNYFVKISDSSRRNILISNYTGSSPYPGITGEIGTYTPWQNGLRWQVASNTSTAKVDVYVNNVIQNNTVYFVTFTFDFASKSCKIYLNGVEQSTTSRSANPNNVTTNWVQNVNLDLAADVANSLFYQGNIYTIQIYNRALTQAEITQNFNALRGRYGI